MRGHFSVAFRRQKFDQNIAAVSGQTSRTARKQEEPTRQQRRVGGAWQARKNWACPNLARRLLPIRAAAPSAFGRTLEFRFNRPRGPPLFGPHQAVLYPSHSVNTNNSERNKKADLERNASSVDFDDGFILWIVLYFLGDHRRRATRRKELEHNSKRKKRMKKTCLQIRSGISHDFASWKGRSNVKNSYVTMPKE